MPCKIKKLVHIFFVFAGTTCVFIAAGIWWGIGSFLPRYSQLKIEHTVNATPKEKSSSLSLVTYNIAHGQGFKNHASDWREEQLTRKKMSEIAAALKKIDADIVLLQEVDLNSNRTHRINQVEWLVNAIGYSYWACAPIWEKNYVPFPYWPIKHHIGEVKTANCILSKYLLSDHKRFVFDKPESNPFWYNWGYIDRGAQHVIAHIEKKQITIINVHFEDQDEAAREKQARDLLQWIASMKEEPMIIAGDFNAPPANSRKKDAFEDDADLRYTDDETIAILRNGLIDESEAISEKQHLLEERNTFTFPSHAPNRRIDHIFALKGAKVIQGRVIKEAGNASDHLPVWAKISF
jgi:endonuclease/exonuclease/phosphatase family metal-dependent hydrolase